MKVGIITFHASHNYGSMLQAYALQQTIIRMNHLCEIINLRTEAQRKLYRPFFLENNWRKKVKALRYPILAVADWHKHSLFEKFLHEKMILTADEYSTPEELKQTTMSFDCYISGSDQIWNTGCRDYVSSYYLDFVKVGRRIAYAPSMGPIPYSDIDVRFYPFIKNAILKYDAVSVREQGTADRLKGITGIGAEVVLDPTLLLSRKEWLDMAGEKPLIEGDYIFLYTPWVSSNRCLYQYALDLAQRYGMKVVCTLNEGNREWGKNSSFIFHVATGPVEFLNIIRHSRMTLSASFHAVVFSIIFGKPFYATGGMKDSRISSLLKIVDLEECAEIFENRKSSYDFVEAYNRILPYVNKSLSFLKNALNA